MFVVKGEIYTFTFEPEKITIHSDISGMHEVSIESNYNEDFSIFDLGPAITDDVEILAASAKIDASTKNNVYLHVIQAPGDFIKFEIKTQPADIQTDPLDSGTRLLYIKDYVRGYPE